MFSFYFTENSGIAKCGEVCQSFWTGVYSLQGAKPVRTSSQNNLSWSKLLSCFLLPLM